MPTHLLEALRHHSTTRPDDIFCHLLRRGACQDITFRDLASSAAGYAERYRALGFSPGAPILVVLEHSPDLLYAFVGAMLAELVPCFLPFPSSKQSAERYWATHAPLFEHFDGGGVVTWEENVRAIRATSPGGRVRVFDFRAFEADARRGATLGVFSSSPDAVALIQHSSGTTGMKKGVALTYGAIADQIARLRDSIGLCDTDCIATWLPLYHDMGLIGCFIAPLTLGLSVAALDPFEWVARPRLLFDAIERYRCTHAWLPNFAFNHLCATVDAAKPSDLGSLKALVNCSEPCKADTMDLFARTFSSWGIRPEHVQVSYGMAENVFLATHTEIGKRVNVVVADRDELRTTGNLVTPERGGERRVVSVGKPLGGVDLVIFDAEGTRLPDDRVGEIALKSSCLFSGYFRNEEATRRKFRDGYYLTGDIGFTRGGELYVLGRSDDRIIVAGKNFLAHDIEHVVSLVPGAKPGRVAAIGVYSEEMGTEDVIVIAEAASDDSSTWPKLRDDIRRAVIAELNLSPGDVRIVAKGWIVKTTSGKVSREGNKAKYVEEMKATAARKYGGTMTHAEVFDAVAGIIRRTFRNPSLPVSEQTAAADVEGWTSLSHATLLMRLEKHFNTRIPDEVAYKVENVGELVEAILVSLRRSD